MRSYILTLMLVLIAVPSGTHSMSLFKSIIARHGVGAIHNTHKEHSDYLQALEAIPDIVISYEVRKRLERKIIKQQPIADVLKPIFSINWNHFDAPQLDPVAVQKQLDAAFEDHQPLKQCIIHLVTNEKLDPRIALNSTMPLPHIRLICKETDKSKDMAHAIAHALNRKRHEITLNTSTQLPSVGKTREHISLELLKGLIITQSCNPALIIHTAHVHDALTLRSLLQHNRVLNVQDPEVGNARVPLQHCLFIEISNAHMLPDKDVYEYNVNK